jgi:tRNA dimethylallyltransferase
MQVYRGMDIGTAKPTPTEREAVPHHLLDVADPDEDFTVTRFQEAAGQAIAGIEARGHRALLVGGTGLYYQAVVDGLTPPGRDDGLHQRLDERAEDGLSGLYAELARRDPVAAGRIEPTNRRRVVRALEVTLATGRPFSSFGPGLFAPSLGLAVRSVGLWLPRAATAGRITERLAAMERQGLVDEVRGLATAPAGLSRTARQAIGYKEILEHLEGGATLEAALCRAVDRTRALSRRQRMWFRRDSRIRWLGTPGARGVPEDTENPLAVLPALLATWTRP